MAPPDSARGDVSLPSRRLFAWLDTRVLLLLGLVVAVAWSLTNDRLVRGMRVTDGAKREFGRFFAAALSPTLVSQGEQPLSLLSDVREGVSNTVLVALAAMSLAVFVGFLLACAVSESFWEVDQVVYWSFWRRLGRRTVRPFALATVRTTMAATRSVHELVWALLLTSMFSVHLACGILAIALPYSATIGRIWGEMLDEAPRDSSRALRALGASDGAAFAFALLPRALPAMLSYGFYRLDCCVRSTAVLGFVGFPTLGLNIRNSFNYGHYREVWTYIYVLFALLAVTEVVSALVRKRITS